MNRWRLVAVFFSTVTGGYQIKPGWVRFRTNKMSRGIKE